MNKELERLDHIIQAINIYHAQLITDGHDYFADKVANIREDMFWLYHELGLEDDQRLS